MSSRRRRRSLLRGVVLTSELQLVLIMVITIALLAGFGIITSTLRQVSSAKVTVSLVRAEALMVSGNTLAITLWLQNSGDTSVTITLVGFSGVNTAGSTVSGNTTPATNVTVNPGETVVFSVAVRASGTPTLNVGMPVYVFVRYQGGDGRTGEVGTVVRVIQP